MACDLSPVAMFLSTSASSIFFPQKLQLLKNLMINLSHVFAHDHIKLTKKYGVFLHVDSSIFAGPSWATLQKQYSQIQRVKI